jgi:hypothetical protein
MWNGFIWLNLRLAKDPCKDGSEILNSIKVAITNRLIDYSDMWVYIPPSALDRRVFNLKYPEMI